MTWLEHHIHSLPSSLCLSQSMLVTALTHPAASISVGKPFIWSCPCVPERITGGTSGSHFHTSDALPYMQEGKQSGQSPGTARLGPSCLMGWPVMCLSLGVFSVGARPACLQIHPPRHYGSGILGMFSRGCWGTYMANTDGAIPISYLNPR